MSYEPMLHDEEDSAFRNRAERRVFVENYRSQRALFWNEDEIDLEQDKKEFKKLTPNEQHYIKHILAFFANSDFLVNEHIETDFIELIKWREVQIVYRFQAMMEDIHSITYAKMIEAFVEDPDEIDHLMNAVVTMPIVKKKADWAKKFVYPELEATDVYKMEDVLVVGLEGCSFCDKAERLLEEKGVEYKKILADPLNKREVLTPYEHLIGDHKTFPFVFESNRFVGGFDDLSRRLESAPSSDLDQESLKITRFARRLIAFIVVEGVFFSSSFACIFWLKSRGVMTSGFGKSNDFISKDEGKHRKNGIDTYLALTNKLPVKEVVDIIREGVKIEQEFARDSLSVELLGMNSTEMCKYIECVADSIFVDLGVGEEYYYKTPNPFAWMDAISLRNKVNFFEARSTDYRRSEVSMETTEDF